MIRTIKISNFIKISKVNNIILIYINVLIFCYRYVNYFIK